MGNVPLQQGVDVCFRLASTPGTETYQAVFHAHSMLREQETQVLEQLFQSFVEHLNQARASLRPCSALAAAGCSNLRHPDVQAVLQAQLSACPLASSSAFSSPVQHSLPWKLGFCLARLGSWVAPAFHSGLGAKRAGCWCRVTQQGV